MGKRVQASIRGTQIGNGEAPLIHESVNDMEDSRSEIAAYGDRLNKALTYFQNTLAETFARNDASAKSQQRRYRLIVRLFSIAGTFAVIFSILHLTRLFPLKEHPQLTKALAFGLFFGEALAVIIALCAVAAGLVLAFQSNWLEQRHKAELLRLLKFSSIADPALLGGKEEEFAKWKERVLAQAHEIKRLDADSLHEWVEEAKIPELPTPSLKHKIEDRTLQDLLDYYRKKRLDPQSKYFYDQAHHNLRWDWSTRLIPPVLFFGSVFFALLHLINEIVEIHYHGTNEWPKVGAAGLSFIILAAILPVFGSGLRGLRSTYEFGRNTLRFRAMHFALEILRQRLERESKPEVILRDLWWCEFLLEAEHREWLRLMIEAEWIG